MVYWIVLYLTIFFCLFVYERSLNNIKRRKRITLVILIILIYFSSFRDGLGEDYYRYLARTETSTNMNFLSEPFYSLLTIIVNNSFLSEVFIFLVFSIITNFFYIESFKRYQGFYLIIAAYILIPGLFPNTFNGIRQFCAASIFLYSIRFIEKRNIVKFLICILVSSTIHISSLILLPFYFVPKKINPKIAVLLQFLSLTPITIYIINLLEEQLLKTELFPYTLYFEIDTGTVTIGAFLIFVNVLFLLVSLFKKKIILEEKYQLVYTMFSFFIILYNASLYFYPLFRVSLYCIIFPFILIPLFDKFLGKELNKIIFISIFIIFATASFIIGSKSDTVIPSKILNPNSLIDVYYYPDKIRYYQRGPS